MGYKGPNEILEEVPERERTLIYVVECLYPKYEIVTCEIPYNFAVLNSHVTGHLGKMLISPNWGNQI